MPLIGNVCRWTTSELDLTNYVLCFPAGQEYSATEGQTLSLACPYNSPDDKEAKKAWCRWTVPNKCDVLVDTDYWYGYQNRAQNGRATIEDDTQKGVVTITMEKLQEDDSGLFSCARYDPPSLHRIVDVKLTVTKGQYCHFPASSDNCHLKELCSTAQLFAERDCKVTGRFSFQLFQGKSSA
uniref:Ig-like domain-containing protein n=1 Tax=Pelusios castaneus TaxID=367368 RepID=A0A8C8S367_9SAUR